MLAGKVKATGPAGIEDAAHLLLDQAMVLEGAVVADPAAFARRLGDIMQRAFA